MNVLAQVISFKQTPRVRSAPPGSLSYILLYDGEFRNFLFISERRANCRDQRPDLETQKHSPSPKTATPCLRYCSSGRIPAGIKRSGCTSTLKQALTISDQREGFRFSGSGGRGEGAASHGENYRCPGGNAELRSLPEF